MAANEADPRLMIWRIGKVEATQGDLLKWQGDVDKDRTKITGRLDNLEQAYKELALGLQKNTRALVNLSIAIAGSAVSLALSVLIATGKI